MKIDIFIMDSLAYNKKVQKLNFKGCYCSILPVQPTLDETILFDADPLACSHSFISTKYRKQIWENLEGSFEQTPGEDGR